MSTEKSTEQMLDDLYQAQVRRVRETLALADEQAQRELGPDEDDAADALYDMPYGVNRGETYQFILAGGGPAAHLEVTVTATATGDREPVREVQSMRWVGAWWSAPVTHKVTEDSPLWTAGLRWLEGIGVYV